MSFESSPESVRAVRSLLGGRPDAPLARVQVSGTRDTVRLQRTLTAAEAMALVSNGELRTRMALERDERRRAPYHLVLARRIRLALNEARAS